MKRSSSSPATGQAGRGAAVLLLSGGLDSAVCLWWALREGYALHTLTVNYRNRLEREKRCTEALARAAEVARHREIDLPFLEEAQDIRAGEDPDTDALSPSRPPTYIPARNAIFYSFAASWAEVIGAGILIGGHVREDNHIFPDSGPEFFAALEQAFAIGASPEASFRIVTPLISLSKAQAIRLGVDHGVPFELTWSCYMDHERPCGRCPGCTARAAGFQEAGLPDPLGGASGPRPSDVQHIC